MKKCVFILPYFGKFNNYFALFLKSCGCNRSFDFLIFTDNSDFYSYPDNVRVIPMTLEEFKLNATNKLGFKPCIPNPYKLCDFKPAYGFLFEDYIRDYDYWGHCDCDLIFGNLEKMLSPVLDKDYDKIFSVGHLVLYKNNFLNNRRFMSSFHGRLLYKEAFSSSRVYVFDEDNPDVNKNPNRLNVHSIFLESGAHVFSNDFSFNVPASHARLVRTRYDPSVRDYVDEIEDYNILFWVNGNIKCISYNSVSRLIESKEYLYVHLQKRKMRMRVGQNDNFEIASDRFLPISKKSLSPLNIYCHTLRPSMFWIDIYRSKLLNAFRKLRGVK